MSKFQHRYVVYCRAHGKSPENMLEHDRKRWPGGRMAGFITWSMDQMGEWRRLNGREPLSHISLEDHAAYDRWLDERFPDGQQGAVEEARV